MVSLTVTRERDGWRMACCLAASRPIPTTLAQGSGSFNKAPPSQGGGALVFVLAGSVGGPEHHGRICQVAAQRNLPVQWDQVRLLLEDYRRARRSGLGERVRSMTCPLLDTNPAVTRATQTEDDVQFLDSPQSSKVRAGARPT